MKKVTGNFSRCVSSMNFTSIPGHPRYEISECGIVLDLKTGKCIASRVNNKGYSLCHIWLESGKRTSRQIHVLLAIAFIPNPDNKPEVDHIDCNKSNNSLDNLRWASYQEQQWNKITKGWTQRPNLTTKPYLVRITNNSGKNIFLGYFATSDEAQIVYEEKCIEWRGVFAPKIYHENKRLRQLIAN